MAPKFALFKKGSKLPLNKGFKNMFELLQSCAQPSNYGIEQENITQITINPTTFDKRVFFVFVFFFPQLLSFNMV